MPGRTGQKGPKAAPGRGAAAPARSKSAKKARSAPGDDDKFAPLHDLTAVKQTERALRDSREWFRSLFQNIREAVAVYEAVDGGKDFVFRDFNPAAEAIEHVRRDDLIGRRVTEVFPGVEAFGLLDVLRRVWKSGKTESFPARVYKDDHDPGTWRENEVYRIPGGEIVAVYRDVTEQVRADETLREDEERYRSLFESANDGIHLLRGDVFVDCNQRAVALFGGSDKSDLIGHRPAEFSPIRQPDGQESEAKARALIRAAEEGAPQRFSWQHLRGDGSTFEAEVALNSLSLGGERFVQAIVRDVSERVRAEEEIRRSLREKETLLREIYHRTKNNMNVIASMLSLRARATAEPAAAAVCRDMQDRIRSMALVHQKLYESRDLSSIDLKDYIETLAANLVQSHGEQAAGLRIVPDLEPVVVPIDIAIPCGMILNELFSNAFKHAFPEGRAGTIRLLLKRTEQDEIEIVFSDDGDKAPEGFDPRAQAGLGLRTLCMLVEHQLQGSVAFEANAGLTCRIRFAAKPPGTETPA